MSYLYELHMHTAETSHCGHVPAAEQVRHQLRAVADPQHRNTQFKHFFAEGG